MQATSAPPRLPVAVKLGGGEDGDPRRGHLKPAAKLRVGMEEKGVEKSRVTQEWANRYTVFFAERRDGRKLAKKEEICIGKCHSAVPTGK